MAKVQGLVSEKCPLPGSEGCHPATSLLIEMLKISFIKFCFSFGQVATQMDIDISRQNILKKHPLEFGLSKSKFN